MADDYVRRGNSILTATQYAAYGNSSGKVKYIVVSKEAVADGLLALVAIKSTSTVKGTMTYHAAVCPRPGVLKMRKTSCYSMCCLAGGKQVLGCPDWDEHVLFQQLTNGADVQPMEVERTRDALQLEVNITSDYVVVFL